MTIPKKGSGRIQVHNKQYRWRATPLATNTSDLVALIAKAAT